MNQFKSATLRYNYYEMAVLVSSLAYDLEVISSMMKLAESFGEIRNALDIMEQFDTNSCEKQEMIGSYHGLMTVDLKHNNEMHNSISVLIASLT